MIPLFGSSLHHCSYVTSLMLLQMIVGVLLFTPLLFLLPTTSVYYVLVLLLHTAVLMACGALQMASRLLHRNPAYFLWCWAFKPGLVPGMHCASCYITKKLVINV